MYITETCTVNSGLSQQPSSNRHTFKFISAEIIVFSKITKAVIGYYKALLPGEAKKQCSPVGCYRSVRGTHFSIAPVTALA